MRIHVTMVIVLMNLSAAINHNEQLEILTYIDYVCQCCQVVYVHGYW